MPLITKSSPKIRFELVAAQKQSTLGGLSAVEALAYNLMKAVQLLCLPDACQNWTVPTLLKQMGRLPALLVAAPARAKPPPRADRAGSRRNAAVKPAHRPARQRCVCAWRKTHCFPSRGLPANFNHGIFTSASFPQHTCGIEFPG